jgi:protein-disulfide isomerase
VSNLKNPVTPTDHSQGPEDAPATLVEYGDYQCPHCGHAHSIVKRVQKHFGKQVRFVFRNFPLSQIHPEAEGAAETAEFAAAHGKFWEMHDLLFENQEQLSDSLFLQLAKKLKLPIDAMESAIESGEFATRVGSDFSGGVRSGVNGTPTFFINGRRHDGPFEYPDLVAAIEDAIGPVKAVVNG